MIREQTAISALPELFPPRTIVSQIVNRDHALSSNTYSFVVSPQKVVSCIGFIKTEHSQSLLKAYPAPEKTLGLLPSFSQVLSRATPIHI
jgi:hypothetical protein